MNFNRIQDGAWFKSSCVYTLKFRKLSNLELVRLLVIFQSMSLCEKNCIISELQIRNKQCLQSGGRSLSSSHENRASPC